MKTTPFALVAFGVVLVAFGVVLVANAIEPERAVFASESVDIVLPERAIFTHHCLVDGVSITPDELTAEVSCRGGIIFLIDPAILPMRDPLLGEQPTWRIRGVVTPFEFAGVRGVVLRATGAVVDRDEISIDQ